MLLNTYSFNLELGSITGHKKEERGISWSSRLLLHPHQMNEVLLPGKRVSLDRVSGTGDDC